MIAAYVRVSTDQQAQQSQEDTIEAWAKAKGAKVKIFRDTFTGRTMNRPGWAKLEKAIRAGKIDTVVVWKLDRLGRTVSGLAALFDELRDRGVALVSLTEGLDLSKPMGRLVANVLASVAEFETEVRGERVKAGQQAARKRGKRWGGSVKGWSPLPDETIESIRDMVAAGKPKAQIARVLGVSRPTVVKYAGGS
jgi:DNA invertase Pin-like site-specific DNA recombinase